MVSVLSRRFVGAAAARPAREQSVAQRINAEIVTLLGWNPAVLMQFAHPLVAAGVAEHSSFLTRPEQRVRRLRQTVEAMLALTFGRPEETARAARGINAIHDRVNGRLAESVGVFPAGTPYSAHDPALLRWVHATMLDLMPRTYELYVGPLSAADKDRYCLETSGFGPLLGMPDEYLPTSVAALDRYMTAMLASGQIAVGSQARALAHEILHPILAPALRPLAPLIRLPIVGLLPPFFRDAYGLSWDRSRERALRATAALTRPAIRAAPAALRHWPAARKSVGGSSS